MSEVFEMDDASVGAVAAPSVTGSAAGDTSPVNGGGERERPTRFSVALSRAICRRVAAGESLSAICAEAAMPHRGTVHRWTQRNARFAQALTIARTSAGRSARAQQLSTYCPAVAQEICERVCEGETVAAICRDPAMPSFGAVHRWQRVFPEFGALMAEARAILAQRLCDEGLEIAAAATRETAIADRLRLLQMRWTAGVIAPRVFRPKLVEPEKPPRTQTILIRQFEIEKRADGATRVVGYRPNPDLGKPERDSEGEWTLPRDRACAPGLEGPPPARPLTEEDRQWL